ncbi:MAG TPA: chemotaxis protein CheA [Ruminococcaceae bacterium]|nr:chemotaxis protein CheA [Oscillospiraceae bacterium]
MAKVEPGMEAMVDVYIFETTALLEQLDEILLRTEKANEFTEEDINEIFRIMHTVKGSSAMMGFENLQVLAHKGEDMFFIIRENPEKMTDVGFVYDLVFQMSDLFKAEIDMIQNDDDYEPTDFSDMLAKLEKGAKMLKGELDGINEAESASAAAPAADDTASAAAAAAPDCTTVRVFFEDGCKMENIRAFMLINNVKESVDDVEIVSYIPEDIESNQDSANVIIDNGFILSFRAPDVKAVLSAIESSLNVESYEVIDANAQKAEEAEQAAAEAAPIQQETAAAGSPAAPSAPAPAAPKPAEKPKAESKAPAASSGGGKQSLISVNLQKLDQLHDIVGEIITTESMVISNPELEGLRLESFTKSARELRKLTADLQDTVMSIRMVPLTGPFQKMNRIVRDMKVKLNKDVELVIEGDTTEVDKSIVDNLNDPLMHLVRNCMDHGIENTAEQRIAAGKPAKGTIKLSAMSSSGEVIITISDDGQGIDTEKVIAKAERNGLLMKPASEYSEREIQNMILLPGFSTNDVVTEYSGRGVGMDVVKSNLSKMGGSLTVESKKGEGTAFIIKIPLTLAIVDGMEIMVGDAEFTVPISVIKESFIVKRDQILNDTKRGEMIMIRGVCYPMLRLNEKFGLYSEVNDIEDGIVLLIESENRGICLFADKLIGEQQVVVKPFPKYLSQYDIKGQGLSGCTIMGDGSISLIIDVNNLIGSH